MLSETADARAAPAPALAPSATELGTPVPGYEGRLTAFWLESKVAGIASRVVNVHLPEGYWDEDRRYPVLYLQDGKSCLDHDVFGHGGWQVHRAADELRREGLFAAAIVVTVDQTEAREDEYVPGAGVRPGPTADAYLELLTGTVVPFVDGAFRTRPEAASRAVGGSSYGGLISLYAGFTRPDVFGTIMAMSPSLRRMNPAARTRGKLPLRIYLDSGTVDWSGGDDEFAVTRQLNDALVRRGWRPGVDLLHAVGVGHNHSEEYWRARLRPSGPEDAPGAWPGALPFVFPP